MCNQSALLQATPLRMQQGFSQCFRIVSGTKAESSSMRSIRLIKNSKLRMLSNLEFNSSPLAQFNDGFSGCSAYQAAQRACYKWLHVVLGAARAAGRHRCELGGATHARHGLLRVHVHRSCARAHRFGSLAD